MSLFTSNSNAATLSLGTIDQVTAEIATGVSRIDLGLLSFSTPGQHSGKYCRTLRARSGKLLT
jgi:hypothetical protein